MGDQNLPTMNRRFFLWCIVALPIIVATARRSEAVIVECANCSDEATSLEEIANQVKDLAQQAQSYAQQLLSYQQQVQSYIMQGQQYANMLTNTLAIPQQIFSQVMGDISRVRNIANQASLLTGNSGSILTRLQGAQSLYNQASYLPANMGQQFQVWQNTLGQSANALGRVLGVQQGQEVTYASLQQSVQAHSQSAQGQMQAIQAGVEMSSLISTQMNQLQTTLTAAAQEQATRDMIASDRQAAQDAAMLQFSQYRPVGTTGSQGF